MTFLAVVVAGLVAVSAAVLALALAIAAARGLRARREARRRAVAEPLRPLILEVAVGEGEESAAAADDLSALDPAAWRTVEPAVLAVLGKVRGDGQRLLVELLAVRGVVTRERERLRSASAVRRAAAAELLGAAAYAPAVTELADLLHDRDAEVRLVAARALGRAGAPGAVGVLDDDATARAARALLGALAGERPAAPPDVVARSLLLLGAPAAEALRAALADPAARVRLTAAEVLGRLGASAASRDLEDLVLRDPSDEVRARAATALGRIGAPSAVSALRAATSPSSAAAVRRAAVVALGEVGDPAALRCLWTLLGDDDDHLADAAAAALLALGAPGVRVLAQVASQADGGSALAVDRAHGVVACAVLAEVLPAAGLAEVQAVEAATAARDAAARDDSALVGAGA
ncbi:HEAT repeat domain-containing protein [Quadrisphaera setariae]|uniref:HEAT repeat domain-containing protein n=1 Tax=Quadrisphaera setariae TaxID=2593304 RepID=A0A5C8ZH56_9ACTN|nr:HEAT repeat domain-containing protein [Quadrisphaera setariae]TXR56423.1 HEAT repeat domain-containing protein [Quadrisphaera setariae]